MDAKQPDNSSWLKLNHDNTKVTFIEFLKKCGTFCKTSFPLIYHKKRN